MSDERQYRGKGGDERRALEALEQTPRTEAPPDVRARALRAFVTGVPAETGSGTPRTESRPGSGAGPRRLPLAVFGGAAALAALLAVYVVGHQPRAAWMVTEVVEGPGVRIAAGEPEPGEEVFAGTMATGDSSEFEIQLGDLLRLRLLPGSAIELPPSPGRWFGRERTLHLTAGEVFGTTGGRPLDFTLRVETPEAAVTLTGTTFAVLRDDDVTCICLFEGSLHVEPKTGADPVPFAPGHRMLVYRDGRAPQIDPLPARERMKLGMMRDAGILDVPQ